MAKKNYLTRFNKLVFIILILTGPFILSGCASKKDMPKEAKVDLKAPAEDNKAQAKEKEPTDKPGETVKQTMEHVVQQGETLSIIAKKYNVTLESIVKLNNITDVNFIVVGQKLLIPVPVGGEKKE